MGFLKKAPDQVTIERTAKIEADKGKVIPVRFSATYKRLDVRTAKAVTDDLLSGKISDEELIDTYLVDWKMPGENGEDVEFLPENVAEAMRQREYRKELVDGFFIVQFGKEFLSRKNGLTPGGIGH